MFYPTATSKINENIYAVRNILVNFFVYRKNGYTIAIDSGLFSFLAKSGLARLGINPAEISHVFLTHTDFDHAGGLTAFKNAKVYISDKEEQMINGSTRRTFVKYNSLGAEYETLSDNQELRIGKIKIKGISTPGHTPGSMSYIVDDTYLFSGDTFALRMKKIYPFYRLQNMDTRKQIDSIRHLALKTEGVSWIFTAHTGYSDRYDEMIARWK